MEGERRKYMHQGNRIYEWEQDMNDVNVFFYPPKWALKKYLQENKKTFGENFVTPKMNVQITANR